VRLVLRRRRRWPSTGREDGVWMTGPTAHVFDGVLTRAFLEAL
jgi:hypothetical protein